MDAAQQKGEKHHGDGEGGSTQLTAHGRQQASTAIDPRALTVNLMEQVCNPQNIVRAYRRVRSNKGSPGVDGMTVHGLADWLRENHVTLTASLMDGTYRPQPVRGVQIPKPGGGQPQLGIPVAVDRLVQQMILQVLNPIFDPTFSNSSYGFRPGRSPHMALEQARKYVAQEGREFVVDLDLEKFFDNIPQDLLIRAVKKHAKEQWMVLYIERWLKAPVQEEDGRLVPREKGTPQGGVIRSGNANSSATGCC